VRPVRLLGPLLGVALLAGCVPGEDVQRQADSTDDGVQATGTLDGARVAISRGEPQVVDGDCDPGDGLDRDLCMVVRTIDGLQVNIVFENPDVLVPGAVLQVRRDACVHCDDVTGHAVVEVRVAGDQRRAESGTVRVREAPEGRVSAEFDLRLPFGDRLTGSFDVRRGPQVLPSPQAPVPLPSPTS
jgi:hypothetical protein